MMTGIINWISNEGADKDGDLLCPILSNPDTDCFCKNLNNRNMLLALRFCISNFNHCAIYKRIQGNGMLNPQKV